MPVDPLTQIVFVLAFTLIVFFLLFHPFLCLMSVVGADDLPPRNKAGWFFFILFTWSIGNLFYTFSRPTSSFFKAFTFFALLMGVVVISFLYTNFDLLPPEMRSRFKEAQVGYGIEKK